MEFEVFEYGFRNRWDSGTRKIILEVLSILRVVQNDAQVFGSYLVGGFEPNDEKGGGGHAGSVFLFVEGGKIPGSLRYEQDILVMEQVSLLDNFFGQILGKIAL